MGAGARACTTKNGFPCCDPIHAHSMATPNVRSNTSFVGCVERAGREQLTSFAEMTSKEGLSNGVRASPGSCPSCVLSPLSPLPSILVPYNGFARHGMPFNVLSAAQPCFNQEL